jgi:hypothetical protein
VLTGLHLMQAHLQTHTEGTHVYEQKFFLGVFVTCEHVHHNKSGITHRGKPG